MTAAACAAALTVASAGVAGNIFVTGHDPDFHASGSAGAANLLRAGLDFVTCGTTSSTTEKFLVVTARPADLGGVPPGHLDPVVNGFNVLGLTEGVHFDVANAAILPSVDFSRYTAIAVASSFGGLLDRATLDALVARSADVLAFLNAGGGIFASSECDSSLGINCGALLLDPAPAPMYEFLPITLSSVASTAPFTVTPFGSGTLGLVDADVNDATHNSFLDAQGLSVVDWDAMGFPTTLAGSYVADTTFPLLPDTAQARDPTDCGLGLLVTWEEAVFQDPAVGGVYNVYRSEGLAAACADAVASPPVVTGLTTLRWFDRSTRDGERYVYVVEAEDGSGPIECDGTGGAVAWSCTEPAVVETGAFTIPGGVDDTLRAAHDGASVTFSWAAARGLLPGETYRLRRAIGSPTSPFVLVNGTADLSRSFTLAGVDAPLHYVELRVADACEVLSLDEYPPTH